MGKNKPPPPQDTYETIPALKDPGKSFSSRGVPAPPEVRYVKDPLSTEPVVDSNYAFHITYHGDHGNSGNNIGSTYATNTGGINLNPGNTYATNVPAHRPNRPISSATLPPGAHLNQSHGGYTPQRTHTLPHHHNINQSPLTRASTEKPRRSVDYDPSPVGVVPNNGNYINGRLRQFAEEGNLAVTYDPMSFAAHPGLEDGSDRKGQGKSKGGKEKEKEKSCCSCPPWWGWLIILLVMCLLAAVLYFIFGQLLNKSSKSGATVLPGSNVSTITTTQSTTLLSTLTKLEQTSTTKSSTTRSTTTSTTRPSLSTSTPTTTSTQRPTTAPPPTIEYHDDFETAFIPMEDTRSLRSPPSRRILSSASTLPECLKDCLSRESPCFGVDYNIQWYTCHLLSDYDYTLEPIGTTPMIHNYRRTFNIKSFCQIALYYTTQRAFASHVTFRSQPSSVDTLEKCQDACLGPFGNGILEDGFQCTAGEFDSSDRSCKLTDIRYHPDTLTDSETSEHFQNDGIQCVQMPNTACSIGLTPVRNRQPLQLDRRFIEDDVTTVPECANRCLMYEPKNANLTCQGFAFTYNPPQCNLYTGQRNSALGNVQGTDFYGIDPPKCARCGYINHPDTSGTGGTFQPVSTRGQCRDRCDRWTQDKNPDEVCYGFDVKTSGTEIGCHILTERGFQSSTTMDIDLYEWDPVCHDCHPTSYIQTAHTSPFGGYPRGKRSLAICARNCQQSISAPIGRRCHGFSHDRVSNECNLFYDYDYDLNGIGTSENSDHYRRMYTCSLASSNPCATYNKTSNVQPPTSNSDLHIQPWDIRTVERCADRCNGYSLFTNTTCHGLVFNQRTSRCQLLIGQEIQLNELEVAPGLDFYKRNKVC